MTSTMTPIYDQLTAELSTLADLPRHALDEWVPDWRLPPPVHGQDGGQGDD